MIKVGEVWEKVGDYWETEEGNLVVIEEVNPPFITYRYIDSDFGHSGGVGWYIVSFLEKFKPVIP